MMDPSPKPDVDHRLSADDEEHPHTQLRLPHEDLRTNALIVGATQSQLRTFGCAIERAGYRVTMFGTISDVGKHQSALEAALLVCNRALGETAILSGYRTLTQRPALILLADGQALVCEGFQTPSYVSYDAAGLETFLAAHLRGMQAAPADAPAPLLPDPEAAPPPDPESLRPSITHPVRTPLVEQPLPQTADRDREPAVPLSTKPAWPAPAAQINRTDALSPTKLTREPPASAPSARWSWNRRATWLSIVLLAAMIGGIFILKNDITQPQNRSLLLQEASSLQRAGASQQDSPQLNQTPTAVRSEAVAGADLTAEIVKVVPQRPVAGAVVNIQVMIRNRGAQAVRDPFWVDLYISPERRPSVNLVWPDICRIGATWLINGLGAGESRTLETLDADPARSNFLMFDTARAEQIYVLIDSYGAADYGAVREDDRNNLAGPLQLTVEDR